MCMLLFFYISVYNHDRRRISADCGHGWNFKSICIAHSAKCFETEEKKVLGWSRICSKRSKTAHVLKWRQVLKRFPRFDQEKINVVTGDESGIHFFESHRKISSRVWLTRDARRHCIALLPASVFNISLGAWRMLMHEKTCLIPISRTDFKLLIQFQLQIIVIL